MIEKLTKEQERLLAVYADKYTKLGLNTDRFDEKFATPIIHAFQEQVLGVKKTPVIVLDNPLECNIAMAFWEVYNYCKTYTTVSYVVGNNISYKVEKRVEERVENKVRGEVYNNVKNEVYNKVRNKVRNKVGNEDRDGVQKEVRDRVWEKVWDNVGDGVGKKVWNKATGAVRGKARDEVWDEVRSKVCGKVMDEVWNKATGAVRGKARDEVRSKVCGKVMDEVRSKVGNEVRGKVSLNLNIYPYQDGSFFAGVFAYYDYMKEVLGVSYRGIPYDAWRDTVHLGLIYPLDDICIVCQKPLRIRLNEKGQAHADGKMAIEYAGNWGVYALNGVTVPEYLAMTPAEKLDVEFFKKEKNADIRAEFLRKYGVERLLKYGKLIDSYKNHNNPVWAKSEYEVWDMKPIFEGISKHEQCPFLKMRNQTTGIWHLEGVNPKHGKVDSIKKALEIREKIEQDDLETLWVA